MIETDRIVQTVRQHYPMVQAIYLFGSFGTENEWPDSDVDLALLLPPPLSRSAESLALGELRFELEAMLGKPVDLINLRQVSTVFQKEIVMADRRIFTGDRYAAETFEMLVLSFYQKLNQERAEIIEEGLRSGRFYDV
jgi:predicted nucleotidyltransferase